MFQNGALGNIQGRGEVRLCQVKMDWGGGRLRGGGMGTGSNDLLYGISSVRGRASSGNWGGGPGSRIFPKARDRGFLLGRLSPF